MKIKLSGLLLFLLLFITSQLTAQTYDYPIKNVKGTEYYVYKVQTSEGLLAIGRKFDISADDIAKLNPEIKSGLKPGQELIIPIHRKTVLPSKTEFIKHTVEKKQTLFAISHKYNMSQEEIEKLNPEVKNNGLKEGMILNIPVIKTKIQPNGTVKTVSVPTVTESKQIEKPVIKEQFTEKKTIKIAFLLPFMLEQLKKEPILERFQNFYAGALMAIHKAKERGISFEIYTYDTDKTEEKMTEVLNNPELKSVDLIVGPAFSNQVQFMGNFAKENKVNTLIPFSSKIPEIENNPYLFQFNPGFDAELKYFFELLDEKLNNVHVVLVEIQGVNPMDDGRFREEAIKSKFLKMRKSFGLLELNSPENVDFTKQLKPDQQNLIIFNTDRYALVSPYLNALNSVAENYKVLLLEQYSWRNQIEKKPDCIYISAFMPSVNEDISAEYKSRFDQFFGKDMSNDLPRYDMLGFDLTNYFIAYINKYGSKYSSKIGSLHNIPFIQSQLRFVRTSNESGYINQTLYTGETKAH